MKDPKIAVAGYVCLDITPEFPGRGKVELSELLRPGAVVDVDKPTVSIGGCVSNTGMALKKYGADTLLLGKIGSDAFGRMVTELYREKGAQPDFAVAKEEATSYSIAIAPPGCDRVFLVNSGANDTFCNDDIDFEALRGIDCFHFGYPSLMRSYYIQEGAETEALFHKVSDMGLITSMDMAMADPKSDAAKENWERIFQKVLPFVDFFTPSFEEICALLQPDHHKKLVEKANGDDVCLHLSLKEDIEPVAQQLLGYGCGAVLLKCGAAGIYFASAGRQRLQRLSGRIDIEKWADQAFFTDSYKPERIASGTGAGDTSIAAFLYSMALGYEPEACVQIAAGEGACNITQYDSLSGLLPLEEVRRKIENGWEQQHFLR